MTVKIIHDVETCIGCGACVASCPDFWEMGSGGKSVLKKGKAEGKNKVLSVKEAGCNMTAAKSCPVNCIHLEDGGKKII